MTTTLEDIRVGDIMLCPDGEERKIEQCALGIAHAGDDLWWDLSDLRNPEFRVGDKVRFRGAREGIHVCDGTGTPHLWALVERAPVKAMSPVEAARQEFRRARKEELQRGAEERATVAEKPDASRQLLPWKQFMDGSAERLDATGFCVATIRQVEKMQGVRLDLIGGWGAFRHDFDSAVALADEWLKEKGYVDPMPLAKKKPAASPRCTLCGHPGTRHYASCEHNPEPKGTLISTLGWDQPAPIVVLAQNDEDVP